MFLFSIHYNVTAPVGEVFTVMTVCDLVNVCAVHCPCNYDDRWYQITTTANVHVHTGLVIEEDIPICVKYN